MGRERFLDGSTNGRCYCFNYQKLVDQFGINLTTGGSDDEDE